MSYLFQCLPARQQSAIRAARTRARFVNEMQILNRLRHPCICQVVGAVLVPELPSMMVMEHMELGSLYGLLHNETMQLEGDVIFSFIKDLVSGMRFLHAAHPPITHADLRSHNCLVDKNWRLKISLLLCLCPVSVCMSNVLFYVSDFGLASTRSDQYGGTPKWMAPGESYTWSVVYYCVLTCVCRGTQGGGCVAGERCVLVCDSGV